MPARTADGGEPAMNTKSQTISKEIKALFRERPKTSQRNPTRKPMCIPETATTCMIPERDMETARSGRR